MRNPSRKKPRIGDVVLTEVFRPESILPEVASALIVAKVDVVYERALPGGRFVYTRVEQLLLLSERALDFGFPLLIGQFQTGRFLALVDEGNVLDPQKGSIALEKFTMSPRTAGGSSPSNPSRSARWCA